MLSVGVGLEDASLAVGAGPPELVPVVVVVVGEEGYPRVLADVAEPAEVGRGLGLVVDGDVDLVAVDPERDRHDVRLPVVAGRGEPGDAGPGESPAGFGVGKLHVSIVQSPTSRCICARAYPRPPAR
jgi:hypothetical protein